MIVHGAVPSITTTTTLPPRLSVSLSLRRRVLALSGQPYPLFRSFLAAGIGGTSVVSARDKADVADQEITASYDVAQKLSSAVGSLPLRLSAARFSIGDRAFFLLGFIACTTSIAFTSFVVATIPTLIAVKRAAISLAKLADTAREELPSTMAAIRLSGMEISDLTLELSDLSQEIADGITKSSQAVQAAEAGIKQIGGLARARTMSMIEERANLPDVSLRLMVVGAAKKTSRLVGQASKTLLKMLSNSDNDSEGVGQRSDRVEI